MMTGKRKRSWIKAVNKEKKKQEREQQARLTAQGHSHKIWSGTVAVGGDAAKGSSIDVRSADHFT